MIALAITRYDIADYVSALFIVYIILIFVGIVASYVPQMPYRPWLRAILDFADETTRPYLNLFRRFLPPVNFAGMGLELGPMLGIFLLLIAARVVPGLIEG